VLIKTERAKDNIYFFSRLRFIYHITNIDISSSLERKL